MSPKQKEQLIIELINARRRRRRFGFRVMLKPGDITPVNSVSYLWAKDNVEIFEKYLETNNDKS